LRQFVRNRHFDTPTRKKIDEKANRIPRRGGPTTKNGQTGVQIDGMIPNAIKNVDGGKL